MYIHVSHSWGARALDQASRVSSERLHVLSCTQVITYNFTGFKPNASTMLQLTFLNGPSTVALSPQTASYPLWSNVTSQTCDSSRNGLNVFFSWGNPNASTAVATQPLGTVVTYQQDSALIVMPMAIPITAMGMLPAPNQPYDTVGLCCDIKPIYLATGVYTVSELYQVFFMTGMATHRLRLCTLSCMNDHCCGHLCVDSTSCLWMITSHP